MDAEGVIGGLHAGGGVADGADAADAAGDPRGLLVGPVLQQDLEEARRLDDLQVAPREAAVLEVDDDVAVPLDPRYVMDGDGR